jgi:hypothetical protein
MNFPAFLVTLVIALITLYFGLEWLGLVFIALAVIILIYEPGKKTLKKTIDDAKKQDAFFPEAKANEYVKGFSKQTADFLIHDPYTEYNYKHSLHKTPQMAKNFFAELKELFK